MKTTAYAIKLRSRNDKTLETERRFYHDLILTLEDIPNTCQEKLLHRERLLAVEAEIGRRLSPSFVVSLGNLVRRFSNP